MFFQVIHPNEKKVTIPTMEYCFHREGGLNELYARRFQGGNPQVAEADWAEERRHLVFFSVSKVAEVLDVPLMVEVRLARPQEGDHLLRIYVDAGGNRVEVPSPPYLLSNVDLASRAFDSYIRAYAVEWANKQQGSDYQELARIARESRHPEQRNVAEVVLWLEFGRTWKTGTAFLCGSNTLNIAPVPDDAQYMPGKVLLPRLMSPQLDIITSALLTFYTKQLFNTNTDKGMMDLLMLSTDPRDAHAVYVCLRVLTLGNIWMAQDRHRHGLQNGLSGPSVPESVDKSEKSLLHLIQRFNLRMASLGLPYYAEVIMRLQEKQQQYHERILANRPPGPGEKENVLYWLPPLREMCNVVQPRRRP